jgi:hypothetical protein
VFQGPTDVRSAELRLPLLSKTRAVCGSAARTDLRGGRSAMSVPTATLFRASEIARRYAFCALLRGSSSPRTPTRLRAKKRVAVGTDIADRPPRRSVRALLTHTALTSDAWRQSARSGKPHCSCRMREFGLQAAIERQKPVGAGSAEKIRTRIQDCTCRASAKTKER